MGREVAQAQGGGSMGRKSSVLLVGDILDESRSTSAPSPFDQDMPTTDEVDDLVNWLVLAGYDVDVEGSVRRFVDAGGQHNGGIVFPLWRGGASRNRTAIVPAVCETRDLPYVGGDAWVQTVCQDKSLSKACIRAAGLRAPNEWVIRSIDGLDGFRPTSRLVPPFVIKPLYSACSIGVDNTSLCRSDEQARARAEELFMSDLGPVVCEEFIIGDEVSLCLLEERGQIVERCVTVYKDKTGKCPFRDSLFTFEIKTSANPNWSIAAYCGPMKASVWDSAELLLKELGKVDLLRIDGRLCDGVFTVIELTPDIHMSTESAFLGGFSILGYTPDRILDRLIQISLGNQRASH